MTNRFLLLYEPTRLNAEIACQSVAEVEATVLMVTHSIIEAVYLGDCVWIFQKHQVEYAGI